MSEQESSRPALRKPGIPARRAVSVAQEDLVQMEPMAPGDDGGLPLVVRPAAHGVSLAGWAETTVIIRFWLLAAMCAALGLGLFYSEWLTASAGG